MRKNNPITIFHLIVARLVLYLGLVPLVIFLFSTAIGHLWVYIYTGWHWQQLPNPEFMRLDLAEYATVDEEDLRRFEATIEVVDETLRVIEARGADNREGYQYSVGEFIDLFVAEDPNLLVRNMRLTLENGQSVTIIFRQPLSMPPYVAMEQMAKVYIIMVLAGSAIIILGFILLAVRAIYKPLHRELTMINAHIAKVPYDPQPVNVEQFHLVEMRTTIDIFNAMIAQMETMRQEKQALVDQNYRLVSNLSHDLKSPMTTLKGYAELLQQEDLPPEEVRRLLSYITGNVEALNTMVEMLSEQVRYQHNDYALQCKRQDMNAFLRDICANYYMMLDKRGFIVDIEIMEEACFLSFDAISMRRVFANLLENIMSHNELPTKIQIQSQVEGAWFVCSFKDDGVGINPEAQALVFEPYYQGDVSRSTHHSGLGLYVAKQLVEKHGGTIKLTSEPDYKTVFAIRLPLENPALSDANR